MNLPKFVPSPQRVSALPSATTTLSASHLRCLLPGLESRLPNWSPSPSLAPFQPTFQKFLTCISDRATCLIDSFQGYTAWHRTGFHLQPSPRGSHPGTSFGLRQPERAGFSPCGRLGSERQWGEKAAKKMRVRRQGSHLRKQAFVPQLESCSRDRTSLL